jgi:hypothetical protein
MHNTQIQNKQKHRESIFYRQNDKPLKIHMQNRNIGVRTLIITFDLTILTPIKTSDLIVLICELL